MNDKYKHIPPDLQALNHWVLWRRIPELDKDKKQKVKPDGSLSFKKMPYQKNGKWAKSNDPTTWTTFDEVTRINGYDGIGFQFSNSGYFGVDFDGIADEVQQIRSGDFTGEVGQIIEQLGSYTEISQSGSGIHIIGRGTLPGADFKTNDIEMYGQNRYFCMTGDVIQGYDTVETVTEQIVPIYNRYNPKVKKTAQRPTGSHRQALNEEPELIDLVDLMVLGSALTDEQIIEKAAAATNGQKFKNLYFAGPGSDHSASDQALCNMLAFWTGKDPATMDRIFRQSALYRPKWDELHDPALGRTYGQMTIDKAIEGTAEVFGKHKKAATGEDIPYFESGNMYWKEIKKTNGDQTAVPISNFILQPIREVEIMETGQIITECRAVNVYKEIKEIKILPADFNTSMKFNDALDSKSMRFNGSLTDLQFIKSLLANHIVPRVTGTRTNGFHRVDGQLIYVDAAGIVGGDSDTIVTMADSPIKSSLSAEQPITRDEMFEILPSLLNFNTPANATSIIGWSCATFLKEMFRSRDIKMPHLFISGEAGSGKSETIDSLIRPLLGIDTSPINANDQTRYALGLLSNASNNSPILLEEFKPGLMKKDKIQIISDLMRNSYDSHLAIRGLPNNRGKTEILTLNAPLLICGEESSDEKANLERAIFCTFGRNNSKKHIGEFMVLRKRKQLLRKLGRATLEQAMKMTPERLLNLYYRADSLNEMNDLKSSRTRNNVAVTICGLYLLNDTIKALGIQFDISDDARHIIANATREEEENEAGLTRTDEMINQMSFVCGILPYTVSREMCDPVYVDQSGTLIYLRLQEIYDATNSYIKKNGLEKDWMPFSQFKKQLKQASYFDGNGKFINSQRGIDRITGRAWSLNIIDMERKGLDLDGFKKANKFYKLGLPEFMGSIV